MPCKPMDLNDPAFPHGTLRGSRLGCGHDNPCPAAPSCRQIAARASKQRRLRKAGVLPHNGKELVDRARLDRHVDALMAVPYASYVLIAKLAGLHYSTVATFVRRKNGSVSMRTEALILRVTPQDVARHARQPVTRKTLQLIHSMQAQGFPLKYQAQKLECTTYLLKKILSGRQVGITVDLAERISRLAASLELEIGPSPESMSRMRNKGWYPLLAYDEEGTLIPGAAVTPENQEEQQRKENRHKAAELRIKVLEMTIAGHGMPSIAQELNLDERQVHRYRQEAGIKFETLRGRNHKAKIRPECADQLQRITEALEEYRSVYPIIDPFEMLRGLGMMYADRYDIDPGDRELLPEDARLKGLRPSTLARLQAETELAEAARAAAEPVRPDGFDRAAA